MALQNIKILSTDPELRAVEADIRRHIQFVEGFTELIDPDTIQYFPLFDEAVRTELRALILEAFPKQITANELDRLISAAGTAARKAEAKAQPLAPESSAVTKLRSVSEDEAAVVAEVDRVIKIRDIEAVYDLVPQLATLGVKCWMVCRSMLYRRFRSELGLRTLDRLVATARTVPLPAVPAVSESIDTHDRWEVLVHGFRKRYGEDWFTAREIAAWFRELPQLPDLFQHLDGDKPGSLERAIGRALNGKRIEAYRGPWRLVHRIDGRRGTYKWRIERI